MSLSGVTFSGLASGLDTRAIVDALVAVERRPILALQDKKQGLNRSKSLFSDFQKKLEALQEKAKAIAGIDKFLDFQTATDDEDKYFSSSAASNATPGSYNIEVVSVASAEVQVSTGTADRDTTQVIDSSFSIIVGPGTAEEETISVGVSGPMTLQEVASAINNATDGEGNTQSKVQASVLDTGGSGANRYKLVVTATEEGADNSFDIEADVISSQTDDFFTAMAGNAENTTAADASIKINGVTVQRASNTISDAIEGVTLNLKGESAGAVTKLTISTDATKTAEKVRAFVDAYNEVVDFVESQNTVSEEGQANSPLFGDITLRSVRSTIRNLVGGQVSSGNTAYSLLSQMGIESDTEGRLTFTESDFAEALSKDPSAVKNVFTLENGGIAAAVSSTIETLNDSVDGIFKARLDSFDRQIRDADKAIEAKERRLEDFEQAQIERFAALEQAMAQLQAQGNAFAGFTPPSVG